MFFYEFLMFVVDSLALLDYILKKINYKSFDVFCEYNFYTIFLSYFIIVFIIYFIFFNLKVTLPNRIKSLFIFSNFLKFKLFVNNLNKISEFYCEYIFIIHIIMIVFTIFFFYI